MAKRQTSVERRDSLESGTSRVWVRVRVRGLHVGVAIVSFFQEANFRHVLRTTHERRKKRSYRNVNLGKEMCQSACAVAVLLTNTTPQNWYGYGHHDLCIWTKVTRQRLLVTHPSILYWHASSCKPMRDGGFSGGHVIKKSNKLMDVKLHLHCRQRSSRWPHTQT